MENQRRYRVVTETADRIKQDRYAMYANSTSGQGIGCAGSKRLS